MKQKITKPNSELLTRYLYNNCSIWEFTELIFIDKGTFVEDSQVHTYFTLETKKDKKRVHVFVEHNYRLAFEPFEVCKNTDTILASLIPSNRGDELYDLTLSFNQEVADRIEPIYRY